MKKLLFLSLVVSLTILSACSKEHVDDNFVPSDVEFTLSTTGDISFNHEGSSAVADFSIDNEHGKVLENEALLLTNNSVNAVSYHWDFGNGMTSDEPNPIIKYGLHGHYPITLTITDALGRTHQTSKEILVLCIFGGGDHSK